MKPTGTIRDIVIGTKIKFVPGFIVRNKDFPEGRKHLFLVTGTICYVNHENRMFRAVYKLNGRTLGQSFKF
nr:MAG TPA: hypothetical protein [Caudoviricetes sp.]